MGFIDKLRRAGGIVKNRLASAVGAIRTRAAPIARRVRRFGRGAKKAAGDVTISGGRVRRGVRFAAKTSRLTSPVGIGLTAIAFAPEIVRGVRAAGRFISPAIARGIAFFGGRQIATAAAAGGVSGILVSRKKGGVVRPSDLGDPSLQTRLPGARQIRRVPRARPTRRAGKRVTARRRKRIPAHGHRVISVSPRRSKRRRRTHASPRHRGHKRVSFTTASGKKVSFLVNPKARHR